MKCRPTTGCVSVPLLPEPHKKRDREMAYQPQEIFFRSNAPVTVDEDLCIAHKGCTVCVDVCPMDLLAINPATQKATWPSTNAGTACRVKRTARPGP